MAKIVVGIVVVVQIVVVVGIVVKIVVVVVCASYSAAEMSIKWAFFT